MVALQLEKTTLEEKKTALKLEKLARALDNTNKRVTKVEAKACKR